MVGSYISNFAPKWAYGNGAIWVPKSAVGHKWSNFQPFGFKFGLYPLLLGISTWKIKKLHIGDIWATFWVLTLFGAQKLRCLITFDAVVHLIWNLAGFSLVMISKRWYGPKFLIFPLNRHMGMGQFWSQKVRSVINGVIFNRFASNLDCTHDFWVSPPDKQERPIWGNLGPFRVNDPFWVNFFTQILFFPKFYLLKFFFTPNFFLLPKFFFAQIFFFFHFSLWHFSTVRLQIWSVLIITWYLHLEN